MCKARVWDGIVCINAFRLCEEGQMFLPHRFLQGSTRITLIHSDFFFVKSFKMDIGQLFWCDVDIVVKQCVKVLFG